MRGRRTLLSTIRDNEAAKTQTSEYIRICEFNAVINFCKGLLELDKEKRDAN